MKNMNTLSDLIFAEPARISSTFPEMYTHRGLFESTADEPGSHDSVRVDVILTNAQMEGLQVGKDTELAPWQFRTAGQDSLMDAIPTKATVCLSEFDPGFVDFKVEIRGLGEMISSARLSALCAPRKKSSLALA